MSLSIHNISENTRWAHGRRWSSIWRTTTGPTYLILKQTHDSYTSQTGIEVGIWQTHDSVYWPSITTELKEYIARCDVCLSHRELQCTVQGASPAAWWHEFVARSCARVAADLCSQDSQTFLVVSDYYSNFIEVECVTAISAKAVIKELKAVFTR